MRGLTEHLGWKLLALLISSLLWILVVGETEVATSMPIVVQYRNMPPDLEITGDNLDRLFVQVRGPVARVSAESLARTPLVLDLSNIHRPGDQTFNVTEKELGLPTGVRLVRAVPAQIRFSLDRRLTRMLPVEVRFEGDPPAGYRVVNQRVNPPAARVSGPEYFVTRTHAAFTDRLNISSTVGAAEFRVPIYVDDPQVRIESTRLVTVSVTLEKIP
ncbi:MAG: hypothetical protein SGI92_28965 [Bryobacteraceae bacterium]|nr:hypothetical protein [Bryobacteraceae bacterium]